MLLHRFQPFFGSVCVREREREERERREREREMKREREREREYVKVNYARMEDGSCQSCYHYKRKKNRKKKEKKKKRGGEEGEKKKKKKINKRVLIIFIMINELLSLLFFFLEREGVTKLCKVTARENNNYTAPSAHKPHTPIIIVRQPAKRDPLTHSYRSASTPPATTGISGSCYYYVCCAFQVRL